MCTCRLWSYNISSRLWTWGTLCAVVFDDRFLSVAGQSTSNSYGGIATYGIPTTNSPSARFGAPLVADVRLCLRLRSLLITCFLSLSKHRPTASCTWASAGKRASSRSHRIIIILLIFKANCPVRACVRLVCSTDSLGRFLAVRSRKRLVHLCTFASLDSPC